jgi:hypothetical protein
MKFWNSSMPVFRVSELMGAFMDDLRCDARRARAAAGDRLR